MSIFGTLFRRKNKKKALVSGIQLGEDPDLKPYDDWIIDCQRRFSETGAPETAAELALNIMIRGVMLAQLGQLGKAIEHYQKAAALLEPLASASKPSLVRRILATVWLSEANALLTDIHDYKKAQDLYDKVISLLGSEDGARREGQCIFRNAPTLGKFAVKDPEQSGESLVIQFAEAIAYRGETRRRLGDQTGALDDIGKATRILAQEHGRTVGETRRKTDRLQTWIQQTYGMM